MKRLLLTLTFLVMGGNIALAGNPDHVQRLLRTKSCESCDLSGVNLTNYDLSQAKLRGANLTGANLTGVIFVQADLAGADLSYADLSNGVFNGANLSRANLRFSNLTNASLQGVKAKEAFDISGATLQQTVMPSGKVVNPQPTENPQTPVPSAPDQSPR